LSSISPERVETKIQFALDKDDYKDVDNVFIQSKIQGMEKFDCKQHYSKLGFKNAMIHYDQVTGLVIRVTDSTIVENKPGVLIIPERFVVCVGVDSA
jgi:hypothetical protein